MCLAYVRLFQLRRGGSATAQPTKKLAREGKRDQQQGAREGQLMRCPALHNPSKSHIYHQGENGVRKAGKHEYTTVQSVIIGKT